MREKYESLSLATLKDLAKARGLKGISTLRKPDLIERMLQEDEKEASVKEAAVTENAAKEAESKREESNAEPARTESENTDLHMRPVTEKHIRSAVITESAIIIIRNVITIRTVVIITRNVTAIRNEIITRKATVIRSIRRQIQHSLTVGRRLTAFWKSCRMDMDLSAARIIFREKMIFMYLRPRSAVLI